MLGCAGELLAAMAAAYVMTPSVVLTEQDKHSLLRRPVRTCLRSRQSFLLLGESEGESERLSCFCMEEDFSPPYADVIRTSKEKGITGDERILNKRF